MKKLILLLLVVFLPMAYLYAVEDPKGNESAATVVADGQDHNNMILGGGPDSFGYKWKDSNDAGGPVYNWVDISSIGTPVTFNGTNDDSYTASPIAMGMSIYFYGLNYSSIYVSTNGFATFQSLTSSYAGNSAIPSSIAPNTALYCEWDDLYGRNSNSHCLTYHDTANNRFIISWLAWDYYYSPYNTHDMQIILNGNDSSIVYQYSAAQYQSSSTVGIENEAGAVGLQVAYNQAYLTGNLAIRFWKSPTLAHDIGVNAILAPGPSTYKDSSYTVSSKVKNYGSNTETNFAVNFIIKDTTGATVYNHNHTIPTLPPNAESTVTFTNWIPGEGKTHTLKSYTSLAGDLDRTNDTTTAYTYTLAHHGSDGPVAYWSYADQNSGGRPYSWVEIAGLGDSIQFSSYDDGNSGMLDMGMNFNFFGGIYSRMAVCTNGWMSFTDSTTTSYINTNIPNSGTPNAMVALMWEDLKVASGGHIYKYHDISQNQFIVEYDSVVFYIVGDSTHCLKMEAIFNGNDNSLVMQYGFFCDSVHSDITIGIENETGTVGLAYDNNGEVLQTPAAGLALTWTYNPPNNDVGVSAIPAPGSITMMGTLSQVSARVHNFGLSTQLNVPVHFEIKDSTGAMVYNQTKTLTRIESGVDSTVTFPTWTPAQGGIHPLTSYTALTGDFSRVNDTTHASTTTYVHRGTGGPVAYWSYADNINGGGPAYSWIDITALGDTIHFGSPDDANSGMVDMGMTFNLFGTTYSRIAVSTNGWLSFTDSTTTANANVSIPSSGLPNTLIALLWDDLHLGSGKVYKYHDTANNRFIVEYSGIEFYPSGGTDCLTIEVIFNGNDNSIKMQYNNFCTGSDSDISIGLEDQAGLVGLAYDNNGEMGQVPLNGQAITWTYAPPNNDVGAAAILAPAGSTIQGISSLVKSQIHNFGLQTQLNIPIHFEIRDSSGNVVYNQTKNLTRLESMADSIVTFPNWTPAEGGVHQMMSYSVLSNDFSRANDATHASTTTYIHHGNGGPVGYWSYSDNISGGGPAYNWVDIKSVGTPIHFLPPSYGDSLDGGNSGFINMGINFFFLGALYNQININVNGLLSFTDSSSNDNYPASIPSSYAPNAFIAPLWGNLYMAAGSNAYYYYNSTSHQFIVQYDSVEFSGFSGSDMGLEVIFNGNDNSIKMQYAYFVTPCQNNITIGIENQTGTTGLAYDNNAEFAQIPVAGEAITWIYAPPAHDIAPTAFLTPSGMGMIGQAVIPQVEFYNNGMNDETSIPVRLLINPGSYNNLQTIASIDSGLTGSATFAPFTPSSGGTYTLTAISQLSSDNLHANDTLRFTFTAIDSVINFEANDGGLTSTNDWQWGTPTSGPNSAYSGQNCWATILDGNYNISRTSYLTFNLNIGSNASLSFAQWYLIEGGYDGGNFKISTDDGATWNLVSPTRGYDRVPNSACPLYPDSIFSGADTTWQIVTFPLNAYAGQAVLARIAFGADGTVVEPGWYIDDFGLSDCSLSFPNMGVMPGSITGSAPSGGSTSVPLTISNTGSGPLIFTARAVQDILPLALSHVPQDLQSTGAKMLQSQFPIGYRTTSIKEGGKENGEPYYPPVLFGAGGPDSSGHYWVDSDEPNGPTFGWVDISSIGTQVTWVDCSTFGDSCQDDGLTGSIPLGMNFDFFGTDYDSVWVSSNGWISFLPQTDWYMSNSSIPGTSDPNAIIAAIWDDLNGNGGDSLVNGVCRYYSDVSNHRFIISWDNWAFYSSSDTNDFSAQIILDGTNGNIKLQYSGLIDASTYTVGIENATGADGLQIAYNQAYLHNGLAIAISTPVIWLSINSSGGAIAPGGAPAVITVGMNAANLPADTYTGNIIIDGNDPNHASVTVPVTFNVTGGGVGCQYVLGDINGNGSPDAVDVTFGVNYLKGRSTPPIDCSTPCPGYGTPFFTAGDVNGSCEFNGVDITFFVNYLKGRVPNLRSCPGCPPMGGAIVPAVIPVLSPTTTRQNNQTGQ